MNLLILSKKVQMNRTLYLKGMERINLTIAEFEEKYYLHDSTIEKINYDAENKTLILEIDFRFWMQLWYDKNTPKNGLIAVIFENVSMFEYENHEFNSILENLDTEIDHTEITTNEVLEIYIREYPLSGKDKFWWIKIKAENVTVEEI